MTYKLLLEKYSWRLTVETKCHKYEGNYCGDRVNDELCPNHWNHGKMYNGHDPVV